MYIASKNKTLADGGSDHELLIAKFRLNLRKVWKTTRQFRYDLNQIPYYCTMEVTNRLKGLDLVDRVTDRGLYHSTGGSDQNHPIKKEVLEGTVVF